MIRGASASGIGTDRERDAIYPWVSQFSGKLKISSSIQYTKTFESKIAHVPEGILGYLFGEVTFGNLPDDCGIGVFNSSPKSV
jgi:hypothetical protein